MNEINRRFFDSLMADKKLSLRGLASRMGMGHSQLSLTFSGARKMTLEEAAQLSQIFGVPLHLVVENMGVPVRGGGKRVSVIGAMGGDGVVTSSEGIERTTAPGEMPDNTIAVQCRTAGTPLEFMDGAVFFCREHNGGSLGAVGRLSLCQIKGGPSVVALVKRGYREGTVNLSGPFRQESAAIEWATPVEYTRN